MNDTNEDIYGPITEPETEAEQNILKLHDFINDIKEGVKDAALIEIYYFSDKILAHGGLLDDYRIIYQQPVFVAISNADKKPLKGFGLKKLQERHGDNFGIKYNETKRRKIAKETPLNNLRVDVTDEKDFNGNKYYDMKNCATKPNDKAAAKLVDLYYKDAKQFQKSKQKRAETGANNYECDAVKFITDNQ
jgi:hypothetical protein